MDHIFLDTKTDVIENATKVWDVVGPYVMTIFEALVIIFIGRKLIKWISNLTRKAGEKAKLERGVLSFLVSLVNIVLYAILIIIVASEVGIPTASLIAVLGSIGVAVGLALQGSLSNFAGGLLILIMKPFLVGDYIQIDGNEGFVTDIDICYTKLRTFDYRTVIIPNGKLSNTNMVNWTKEKYRRVEFIVPISYEDDIKSVKSMLFELAAKNELIINTEELPMLVQLQNYGESSIDLIVRMWCKTPNYWKVLFGMKESIRYGMIEKGFTIPFKQVDLHMKEEK